MLERLEDLVCGVCERILKSPYKDMLLEVNPDFKVPKRPFKRMLYSDAIQWLKDHDIKNEETGFNFFTIQLFDDWITKSFEFVEYDKS